MKVFLYSAIASLLLTTAMFAVDKFVTPDKLPSVPKQQRPAVQPADEPPAKNCKADCPCSKPTCNCANSVSGCAASRYDESALKQVMEAKPSASVANRRVQCLVFTMPGCPPCVSDKSDRVKWIGPAGWIEDESTAAHFRDVDIYKHADLAEKYGVTSCPTYITVADGMPVAKHTGSTPKETLVRDYLNASKMLSATPAVGGVTVGTLTKEEGDWLKKIFGKPGPIAIPNTEIQHDTGTVLVTVPESFAGTCEHANGVIHAKFTTPISASVDVWVTKATKTCDGIVIDGNKVTFELPGYLIPNAVMVIEE